MPRKKKVLVTNPPRDLDWLDWTIELIPTGPGASKIGVIKLHYGPANEAEVAIGKTRFSAHAETHERKPRVLIAKAGVPGGGFGKSLPEPVQLWTQPGDEAIEMNKGFYLLQNQAFAIGDLMLQLVCHKN